MIPACRKLPSRIYYFEEITNDDLIGISFRILVVGKQGLLNQELVFVIRNLLKGIDETDTPVIDINSEKRTASVCLQTISTVPNFIIPYSLNRTFTKFGFNSTL